MEADEGENPELANLQLDEEKDEQEIAAAAREVRKVILSRMKFMRRIGRPLTLMRTKEPMDPRILLDRKSNCDHIDMREGDPLTFHMLTLAHWHVDPIDEGPACQTLPRQAAERQRSRVPT
jgi:hypothetical protein